MPHIPIARLRLQRLEVRTTPTVAFDWAVQGGSTGADAHPVAAAVDSMGNICTVGRVLGIADFDPGPGTVEVTGAFVAKYNPMGELIWARSFAGSAGSSSLAVDEYDNVYVAGSFFGTVDFDPSDSTQFLTSEGESDNFLVVLDNSGAYQWAVAFGGAAADQATGVAVDSTGSAFITGYYFGVSDFDPSTAAHNLTSAGHSDNFLVRLDTGGVFAWANSFGGPDGDNASSVAVDASGTVYVGGQYSSTADFDPLAGVFEVTSNGLTDAFLAAYDSSAASLNWVRSFGGTGGDNATCLTVNDDGIAHMGGYFYGTADFDPSPATHNLISAGDGDAFLVRLDSIGRMTWAKSFGGPTLDFGVAVAADRAGNSCLVGNFSGTADFDPSPAVFNRTSNGTDFDAFIVGLRNTGAFDWAGSFGAHDYDSGDAVAVDGDGHTYVAGNFVRTVDFDPADNRTFQLSSDSPAAYLVKLTATGPLDIIAAGPGPGAAPQVKVYNALDGTMKFTIDAYESKFRGGVTVATGDVTGDGVPDVITGPGPGRQADVKIFDGVDGQEIVGKRFLAFAKNTKTGVFVAAGDVDGDGFADVIVSPGKGAEPRVRVISGKTGAEIGSFLAYAKNFRHGIHVAAGDVNGDGKADVITAPAGGSSQVRVFDLFANGVTPPILASYNAFNAACSGGVFVAAGDVQGDAKAEVIVSPDSRPAPKVRVLNGLTGEALNEFEPFAGLIPKQFGLRVAVVDRDGDGFADIVVGTGPKTGNRVRTFNAMTGVGMGAEFSPFDPAFRGGVYVG